MATTKLKLRGRVGGIKLLVARDNLIEMLLQIYLNISR